MAKLPKPVAKFIVTYTGWGVTGPAKNQVIRLLPMDVIAIGEIYVEKTLYPYYLGEDLKWYADGIEGQKVFNTELSAKAFIATLLI